MNKKRTGKRIAAWFLCLAMVLTTVNLPAFTTEVKAAETKEVETVNVSSLTANKDITDDSKAYVLTGSTSREIHFRNGSEMSSSTENKTFDITFDGLNETAERWASAMTIEAYGNNTTTFNITLKGESVLKGGNHPGLYVWAKDGAEVIVNFIVESGASVQFSCNSVVDFNDTRILRALITSEENVKINISAADSVNVKYKIGSEEYADADTAIAQAMTNQQFTIIGEETCIHEWEAKETVAATCADEGYTLNECKVCHVTRKIDIVAATGIHKFIEKTGNSEKHICEMCGVERTHNFSDQGDGTHKCADCGATETHEFVLEVKEGLVGQCKTKETCGVAGEYYKYCSNCDALSDETFEVSATGKHTFSEGVCADCGAENTSENHEITTWAQLKAAMESATEPTTIVLTQDIVATAEDKAIFPAETSIVLDLNGYTLDRNLSEPGSANNGCVFFMQRSLIDLTIKDSSPAKTGVITGGYATTCAGCIELGSGSLTLLGGTITGNKTLYYGGGIDKFPYAKLMVGGTARVIGNYAYETGIKQWNSDIHFNDNVLDGFSFATGDDALVTEGEHKAQFGIRFWTGTDIAPELWTLPSYEAGSCFVSNNQREKYRTSVEEDDDGEFLLVLTLHDHEFDGIKCTSACELCGMVREDGIHNMKGEGCTQECSYCHIKVHSNDTYDSKGVCPECKAYRVDDETLLDYQGVRYRLKVDSKLNTYAEVYGYADDIKESVVIPKTIATSNGVFRVASFATACFQGCTRVKDVDIQAEVTFIANSTFSGCSNLTSVVIPNSVTEIGYIVFEECSSLTSINLPDGLTTIKSDTFDGCSSLTSINLPDGLTTIGSYAFRGCSSLASINLPDGLTTIGDHAFEGCSSLASINLPDGLTTIGNSAFMNCSALKSIVIPGSVQTIDNYAFKSTGLTSVTINQGVEEIGGYDVFSNCLSLTDVSLPGSLKTIGSTMFSGCTSLAEIVIPNGVETIKNGAFSNCTSLTEVVIPDGVKFIRQNAFGKCTNLKSVTIPSSVISVELYYTPTFDGCSSDKLVINVACTEYLNEVTPKQWGDFKEINRIHDFTAEEAKDEALKSAATCLDEAVYYRSCTVCGRVNESDDDVFVYGESLGHDYTSETATAPYLKSKATCIADAVYFHKCSRCESRGATTWIKEGSALGHEWGEYILEGDQTCEEDGHKTAMCTREGCTVTNTIEATGAALGHDYTSETATAPYLKSKATCTADAVYYHKCSHCESRGATTWTKEGSALGHEWGEYHLDGDQTCTYDGHKTAECTREGCSEENKIGATGAALGHDWEDYFTTDIAATCTEAGSESRHCARCSATTDVAPIVAHGHSFTDYISNGDATTEADGTKTAVCDHGCGETDTVIDEGSRIPYSCSDGSHSFADNAEVVKIDENKHGKLCTICHVVIVTGNHDFVAAEGDNEKHECSVCHTQGNHDFSTSPDKCSICGFYADLIGAKLAGYSLSLHDNIGVDFYMELADSVMKDEGAKFIVRLEGDSLAEIPVSEARTTTVNGNTYYVFECRVAAAQMTGCISAKIVLGDGTEGTEYQFTVQEYAKYILEHEAEYEEVVPVVKAMLSYGASAQNYFGHNTDKMADEILSEADRTAALTTPELTAYNYSVPEATDTISFLGTSLLLESEVSLKCYFYTTVDLQYSNVIVKYGDKVLDTSDYRIGKNGNVQYVIVTGLTPADYGKQFTITVQDITVENVSAYGYMAQAFKQMGDSDKLTDLLKNMYAYGEAYKKCYKLL